MFNNYFINIFFTLAFLCIIQICPINAYIFDCLNGCMCNTEEFAVHCHSLNLESLEVPKSKLRGFDVIGLTNNKIKNLPTESELLGKFPDLKAVDLEGNRNFDCSSLENFKKLTILSDCGKTEEELEEQKKKLPTSGKPTEDCDFECMANRRAEEFHQYLLRLWEMIKSKVSEISKKHGFDKFIDDIQKFFSEDVSDFFKGIGKKFHDIKF
uniref:Uncharacterized protein n=1 Tax=Meloidogyne incognita TaxID=6306 RepID=A0A914KW49_MELIC